MNLIPSHRNQCFKFGKNNIKIDLGKNKLGRTRKTVFKFYLEDRTLDIKVHFQEHIKMPLGPSSSRAGPEDGLLCSCSLGC